MGLRAGSTSRVTDFDKTIEFYSGLFGWEAEQDPRPEAGGYTTFTLHGKLVAAAARRRRRGLRRAG